MAYNIWTMVYILHERSYVHMHMHYAESNFCNTCCCVKINPLIIPATQNQWSLWKFSTARVKAHSTLSTSLVYTALYSCKFNWSLLYLTEGWFRRWGWADETNMGCRLSSARGRSGVGWALPAHGWVRRRGGGRIGGSQLSCSHCIVIGLEETTYTESDP